MRIYKIPREIMSKTIKKAFKKEGNRDYLICTNENNLPDIWHKATHFRKDLANCIFADCSWIDTLQDENGLYPNEQGCNLDYIVNFLIDESEHLKLHHEFKTYEGSLIEEFLYIIE